MIILAIIFRKKIFSFFKNIKFNREDKEPDAALESAAENSEDISGISEKEPKISENTETEENKEEK